MLNADIIVLDSNSVTSPTSSSTDDIPGRQRINMLNQRALQQSIRRRMILPQNVRIAP